MIMKKTLNQGQNQVILSNIIVYISLAASHLQTSSIALGHVHLISEQASLEKNISYK